MSTYYKVSGMVNLSCLVVGERSRGIHRDMNFFIPSRWTRTLRTVVFEQSKILAMSLVEGKNVDPLRWSSWHRQVASKWGLPEHRSSCKLERPSLKLNAHFILFYFIFWEICEFLLIFKKEKWKSNQIINNAVVVCFVLSFPRWK